MYNPKSEHAEDFMDDGEILDTLDYAARNKNNRSLVERILQKASECKGTLELIMLNAANIDKRSIPSK